MNRYLIDSNIIIKLWERNEDNLSELIKENKIVILKDVLEEISIKEKRKYKGNYILSQRFCELLPVSIEIDKKDISGFNISKSLLGDKRVWSIDNLISSLR